MIQLTVEENQVTYSNKETPFSIGEKKEKNRKKKQIRRVQ